jgi:hypothetical protein
MDGISAESITLQESIMTNAKTKEFAIITDNGTLTKLIVSIKGRGKALDKDMHTAAVSALFHGFEYKSTAHAESLLASLPASARKNALKVWFMDLGCFLVKEDGKTLGIDKVKHSAGWINKETAISTPFYKYSEEPAVPSPLDAMELVRALIKKLNAAKGKGELDADSSSVLDKLLVVAPAVV